MTSSPNDVFTGFDPGTALFDAGNNTLSIGAGAAGSFSALAGAHLIAGALNFGEFGGNADGSGTIGGSGALAQLTGNGSRLLVGNFGSGSLTVSGGAVVDAALNLGSCVPVFGCSATVGNAAGSTGLLTVTGVGSEIRTARFFSLGVPQVYTLANGGFDFGAPGGTSTATVQVLAGGSLRTQGASLGLGPTGPGALGTEKSFVTALVEGPGSQWIVTRNTVDNAGAAIMAVGGHANATADVTVSNGGLLRIDGTGGAGPNSGIHIGTNGKGTLVLTGAGSRLETAGLGQFINVGANNAAGDGSFQILAGATAESLFLNVGRNGGKGTLLIDGAGSNLTLSGVNTDAGSPGAAGGHIGRNGGTGGVTVSNGGRWLITDDGQDTRAVSASPGLTIGREANGVGALTITGAGSTVEIVSTALPGLASGESDNFNPFLGIGRGSPTASGTLTVSNGGKLIMTGNAVSTAANGHSTNLNIGGRSTEAGNGSATVTGAGSEIIVQGYDAYIGVGRFAGSTGVLNVLDQGKVSATSLLVGAEASGTVNVNAGTIALSGYRTDSSQVGAGSTIGRGSGGVGTLNLVNGSAMTIAPSVLTGGMSIGGDQFQSGGTGTVSLSGASSIVFGGTTTSSLRIGRSGVGTMNLADASLFDAGTGGTAYVADTVGGSGVLSVTGGSLFKANEIGIGGLSDSTAGGIGSATVSGAGSELRASGDTAFVSVGRTAVGTLSASDQAKVTGIVMNVGRAAGGIGTLTVNHASVEMSGQQTAGLQVGAAFTVGNRGGTGSATFSNGGTLSITNSGSNGASLNLGGTPINPLGTGTLEVTGGSQVKIVANPGQAIARIGHDGTGSATFSGASLLEANGGDVIIAGEPGATGTVTLNSGSTLNADYVGVGSKRGGVDGGNGRLFVNDSSEVFANTVEIGTNSLLGGNLGTVHTHELIVRGTLSPGNSPGRLKLDLFDNANGPGRLKIDGPGRLKIDVGVNADGSYSFDELILNQGASFDLKTLNVEFSFLGNTDPEAFAATGKLDLDTFIRAADANGNESGLSSTFAPGTDWDSVLSQATFTATSSNYSIQINMDNTGGGTFNVVAQPVPEPGTWALWLVGGSALLAALRRRTRGRQAS